MARTTPELVAGVVSVTEGADLAPFIDTASSLVDELLGESALSTARLELIERWLSAHFYLIHTPATASEGAGAGIQEAFQYKVDLRLQQTRHGQQVLLLDTTGAFASLNAQSSENGAGRGGPNFIWLGTDPRTLEPPP